MIVLDTNVLSEALRATPDAKVVAWLARQQRTSVFTTTVTRAEVFYGIHLLPAGARKHKLRDATQAIFDLNFAGQLLSFDSEAADVYAAIAASSLSTLGRVSPQLAPPN